MHRKRHEERAQNIGPLRSLLIIDPLPDTLLDDVMRRWPEGHLHRDKVLTYIRHCASNYDAVRLTFGKGRYDELRRVTDEKTGAALDGWLLRHPEAAATLEA